MFGGGADHVEAENRLARAEMEGAADGAAEGLLEVHVLLKVGVDAWRDTSVPACRD